jgi:hypothetical protein
MGRLVDDAVLIFYGGWRSTLITWKRKQGLVWRMFRKGRPSLVYYNNNAKDLIIC